MQKQPKFTRQADTVADSSWTQSVALLVHPSGTVHSIADCYEFTGSQSHQFDFTLRTLEHACIINNDMNTAGANNWS